MHGASRLELSTILPEAVPRYSLLEERHLRWVEDEERAASALQPLPKTTPSRPVSCGRFNPQCRCVFVPCSALRKACSFVA